MIPVELKISNFISYGPDNEPLRFDGFNIACLTGNNGNGKSALLDAITWAVWGMARGTDERGAGVDDLVRSGADNMEVEFTFQLEGDIYRICRRRDKGRGKSSLEFQIYDGGIFRSLTGENISSTQRKINQVLRMDYHTFTSSSFLLQGKADTFTSMKPSERKKILGEILGLSVYQDLEALAREEVNAATATCSRLDAKLEEIEKELTHQQHYQKQKLELEQNYRRIKERLDNEQEELEQWRRTFMQLQQIQERVKELQGQLEEQQKSSLELKEKVNILTAQIKQGEELLSTADEIEKNYTLLQQLQQKDREHNEKSRMLLELKERKRQLEIEIDEQRSILEKKYTQLKAENDHYNSLFQSHGVLAAKESSLMAKLQQLREEEAEQQKLKEAILTHNQQIKSKELFIERLKEELTELREKYTVLRQPVAQCPLCRTELSGAHKDQVLNDMIKEGEQLNHLCRLLQQEIDKLKEQTQKDAGKIKLTEEKLSRLPALENEHSVCRHKLSESLLAGERLKELQPQMELLNRQLQQLEYAKEQQESLRQIEKQINSLGYSPQGHSEIQKQIAALKQFESRYHSLQTARSTLASQQENLQHFNDHLLLLEKAVSNTRELIEEHSLKLVDLPVVKKKIADATGSVTHLQQQVSEIERQLGTVQEKLDRCTRLTQEKQVLTAEKNAALEEKKYYNQLVKAFGKKGIQALIIENAIPELEREANSILQQVSDGRLTVALVTQKAAKSSKRVLETLEIVISDEYSTRRYELYSGGEAFKVNFALRIALSRLLARRAGARLQMLVIDEGFGTQDNEGKERLVQAINAIAADFEKIIVITHIEELKNAFPVQMVVTKGINGSRVELI
ncbi:AAA family ATPase [Desulfofalx alkaliphila]|uniref:AAA family ATPase n=1 Tax=Desulfofalx alkaliphila TaxID=105483 RepID=UPI0004E1B0A1|nr:SMC family ATPase [Desulfofalx alkaliphila]